MFEKSCFKPGGKNRYYRDKLLLREEKTFSLVCWGFVWPHLAGDQSREEVVGVVGPRTLIHRPLCLVPSHYVPKQATLATPSTNNNA